MFDVVIVGAGVIGLSCAMRLQEAGARVAVVTADEPETTTSWIAAAVWYPTHTEADPRVLGWASRTFDEFVRQAKQGVPGVTLRPTRMLLRASTVTPWWAAAVPDFRSIPAAQIAAASTAAMSSSTDVLPSPTQSATQRTEVAAEYTGEWRFTVPAVEMGPYLHWQTEQITSAGGALLPRRLQRLTDVADLAPITVNATGLAAGRLADDDAVHPIRGRIVVVTNPGITTSIRDEDNPAGMTYVHPRSRDIILGGTFEPGQTDLTPDPHASAAIVARCTALVPELAHAQMITQRAGLRPGRHGGVRLGLDPGALDARASDGHAPRAGRLIHNYGHGGAGMTLSWGCADEVAALIT